MRIPLSLHLYHCHTDNQSVNSAEYKLTHAVFAKSEISGFFETNIILIPLFQLGDSPISDKSIHAFYCN